jgi:hypothetical protein
MKTKAQRERLLSVAMLAATMGAFGQVPGPGGRYNRMGQSQQEADRLLRLAQEKRDRKRATKGTT